MKLLNRLYINCTYKDVMHLSTIGKQMRVVMTLRHAESARIQATKQNNNDNK